MFRLKEKMKSLITSISRIDLFSPAIFFPLVLLAYNLAGNLFDAGRSDVFKLKHSTYPLIVTALVVYYLVYYFVRKRKITLPSISVKWFSKLFYTGIAIATVIGFASLSYLLLSGQIGLIDESVRRNISPVFNFLSAFFWFGYLILITAYISKYKLSKKKSLMVLSLSVLIVLALYVLIGYRTNLFVIVFTLILFFHYHYKRFNFVLVISMLLVVSISFSVFGNMRLKNEDQTNEFNNQSVEVVIDEETKANLQKTKELPEWFKVITAEFVNGKIVLSRIIEHTSEEGVMKGKLHFSAIETMLPGTTKSPRAIVTDVVNTYSDNGIPVTREGRTTTPGLLGQLFLDGGYLLLVIGIGFVSFLLTSIYNKLEQSQDTNYKISYAFLTTLLTLCIHTGLLDVIFYIFFLGMIVYAMIQEKETN